MLRRGSLLALPILLLALSLASHAAPDVTAVGEGRAIAWFSIWGLEAELDGSLEFTFLGLPLIGSGHGVGHLDPRTFTGWAWAVVWAEDSTSDGPRVELAGGFAVEGSSALGSGSVTGTCAFVVRRNGVRTDYRGTFVTRATSRLVPATRSGTLELEGQMELDIDVAACSATADLPWDSTRWPPDLLAELLGRFGP